METKIVLSLVCLPPSGWLLISKLLTGVHYISRDKFQLPKSRSEVAPEHTVKSFCSPLNPTSPQYLFQGIPLPSAAWGQPSIRLIHTSILLLNHPTMHYPLFSQLDGWVLNESLAFSLLIALKVCLLHLRHIFFQCVPYHAYKSTSQVSISNITHINMPESSCWPF